MEFNKTIENKAFGHSDQFVLMMQTCIDYKIISKATGKVFIAIASHWRKSNKMWPSRNTIADICGYKSVRNVTQHTAKLKELGLISFSQKRKATKSGKFVGQNNVYSINEVAFKSFHKLAVKALRDTKYKLTIKKIELMLSAIEI